MTQDKSSAERRNMQARSSLLALRTMTKKRLPPEVLEYFKKQGRKGGRIGAKKVADEMTKEQRTVRAKKAAAARWSKGKGLAGSE